MRHSGKASNASRVSAKPKSNSLFTLNKAQAH
jgi:hypothetical protein